MRHLMKTPLLLLWLAAPAVAAECPPAPDVTEELQGLFEEARAQLLIAVENNPWLSEAALLADGAPLGPKGKDI